MSAEYKEQVKAWFRHADRDGSGTLSRLELVQVMKKACPRETTESIDHWFDQIDTNKDNSMSFEELWAALNKRDPAEVEENELRACFKKMDQDGSGFLEKEELVRELKKHNLKGNVDKIVACVDCDGDGKISVEEFLKAWRENK